MKKASKLVSCLLAGAMVCSMAACSSNTGAGTATSTDSGSSTAAPVSSGDKYEMVFGGSHSSGTGYQWAVAAAGVINKYAEGITISPINTTGAAENVNLMEVSEIQLGNATGAVVYFGKNGMMDWEGQPTQNMDIAMSMYEDFYQVVVPAGSDINSIEDLEGKRVSLNAINSGPYQTSILYFETLGIDLESFVVPSYLSASEGSAALQEGSIDAMIYIGGMGASALLELASSRTGLKLITFNEDQINTLCDQLGFIQKKTIPAGTYDGVDYDLNTIGSATSVIIAADVPDESAYEFAKVLHEHHDELVAAMSTAEYSTLENTFDDWNGVVDIHPGILQYMEEIGIQ